MQITEIMNTGRGYSLQKFQQECASDIGSNVNCLVYQWPLMKIEMQIWFIFESFFQSFTKLQKFDDYQLILVKS